MMSAVKVMAPAQPRSWIIEDSERPWTANAERSWHYHKRAAKVREAREAWGWLARVQRIPALSGIRVDATPLIRNHRALPDVAACYPTVKAAIDGFVDAGIIPDDDPFHVPTITFHAPSLARTAGLRIKITEVLP